MEELKRSFPPDVDYAIVYDTTPFIDESIHEVFKALRDAIILVAIVVLAFLQSWRATLIPLIAVPVAIVGTFAVMLGMGFSLNNLSLFGLVLAIGIVVDDAIVVVEAVEHHLEHGLSPKAGGRKGDERSDRADHRHLARADVRVHSLRLHHGHHGQFFRQFALTIAVSTFFSAVNSLTLSPALCGLLLKPKHEQRDPLTWLLNLLLGWFFKLFNLGFKTTANVYARGVGIAAARQRDRAGRLRRAAVPDLLRLHAACRPASFPRRTRAICWSTCGCPTRPRWSARRPSWRRSKRLPAATASHDGTRRAADHESTAAFPASRTRSPSPASRSCRTRSARTTDRSTSFSTSFIIATAATWAPMPSPRKLRAACYREVQEASVAVFGAPAVDGLGNAGGFKVMVRDVGDLGLDPLQEAADDLAATRQRAAGPRRPVTARSAPRRRRCTSTSIASAARRWACRSNEVFLTLQLYLGGYYTNDFNQFGRTWQVNLQGDPGSRLTPEQVRQLKVRNAQGRDGAAGQRRRRSAPSAARRW